MFLTPDDYTKLIKADVLEAITNSNPAIVPDAQLAAQAEMESYLRLRYDVAAIFQPAPTPPDPDTRNRLIVMYMVDIVLYHIHSRINPRQIPELRGIRYDAAIKWLQMVASGQLSPDLPPLLDADGNPTVLTSYAGFVKRNMDY